MVGVYLVGLANGEPPGSVRSHSGVVSSQIVVENPHFGGIECWKIGFRSQFFQSSAPHVSSSMGPTLSLEFHPL